jgi:hypothetical protein
VALLVIAYFPVPEKELLAQKERAIEEKLFSEDRTDCGSENYSLAGDEAMGTS